jgi:hypothetical protein
MHVFRNAIKCGLRFIYDMDYIELIKIKIKFLCFAICISVHHGVHVSTCIYLVPYLVLE